MNPTATRYHNDVPLCCYETPMVDLVLTGTVTQKSIEGMACGELSFRLNVMFLKLFVYGERRSPHLLYGKEENK